MNDMSVLFRKAISLLTAGKWKSMNDSAVFLLKKYKSIFVQVPKTGSSSILKIICQLENIPWEWRKSQFERPSPHEWYSKKYSTYFKFAFVRNPFDRLVSVYLEKVCKDPSLIARNPGLQTIFTKEGLFKQYLSIEGMYPHMPFKSFVAIISKISDEKAERHLRSQNKFICSETGEIFVDFVGRFENFEKEIASLMHQMNVTSYSIPHLLKSDRKHYSSYYDSSSVALVKERYKGDLKLFSYQY